MGQEITWVRDFRGTLFELLAWVWKLMLLRGEWTVSNFAPPPVGSINPSCAVITSGDSNL